MSLKTIEKITRKASRIRNGNDKIKPGETVHITEAFAVNDGVRQGDLYFVVVDSIPIGYQAVENPGPAECQLVPGSTQGSKHCLDSLFGVQLYRHSEWGQKYEGLDGPVIECHAERTVTHPTHGNVVIPAGTSVRCYYQREYDVELKRERRNAD